MSDSSGSGRNLALEAVRVTEAAALAASRLMGRGDDEAADRAAITAMHRAIAKLAIDGAVRFGDNGDLLFPGEKVGAGNGPQVDVAVMALEGPTIIAKGEPNGLSILAMSEEGGFLNVPDLYMEKIAVGAGLPEGIVSLERAPAENLSAVADAKDMDIGDLVVCVLDRPRHAQLISQVREAGARIVLIRDGDVSGALGAGWPESGIDLYMGIGGAPQGVMAAAALNCVGGQMQARLVYRDDGERHLAQGCGIHDLDRIWTAAEMANGDVTFAATGVTNGALLAGVQNHGVHITHSIVMRSVTGTVRYIEAHHNFADGRP
ncbi:class II fructose-bisphosphatase [Varunaivibrio sulfuroxidans]|uniref:Fructose-1,6-bisphosphatase n=1 Tax=Varunaivibrio sulfuroxidans TaxID=1773489 RepID=A0A4R3JGB9_9PROT|nr:class II fructose-bisphosphatase [Varunaivibrio sulfuroxidans]TCS64343.1 fructose-1,6-bisphosphatase II / sedoheptulose-1,7-bisphosphatase [Varunaivibrio sulfuroxidans]WES31220.1 class II fructose-bisphosphatase [Varunaivibrio sulfuroxidans]